MFSQLFKTPLSAAFFCVFIFAGCSTDQADNATIITQCPARTAAIASVQGALSVSPMLGQQVTVQGITTLVQDDGLYIEEPDSDTDKKTSDAVFIQFSDLPVGIAKGSMISARGEVSEIGRGQNTLTAITDVEELVLCSPGNTLPLTKVSLPLNGPGRESLEGMRIRIDEKLTITDIYQLGRGNFTLSGNGFQFTPTEVVKPGPDAVELLAENRAYAIPVSLPPGKGNGKILTSGVSIDQINGVFAHDGRNLRVSLQSVPRVPPPGYSSAPATAPDSLRFVAMNLHNYFNGDGKGSGFLTDRGAKTAGEFEQQRDRIAAAIQVLNPHVIAVMELENDGFDTDSSAQDLVRLANGATGKDWAVTRPVDDNTGANRITVGIFYRTDKLKALGPAQTLAGSEFKRSRQPQAQLFQQLQGGGKILVVINHFKSKGSCPKTGESADQKDGQGCWNPVRTASAIKTSGWATGLGATVGTDNILMLGDMNAYRNEDPIAAIREAGYVELLDEQQGQAYSFVYFGQAGTLDYAFASPALREKVQQAFIWNVNTVWPPNMELPQPWLRFSDHDPVVVDLRLRHASTSD